MHPENLKYSTKHKSCAKITLNLPSRNHEYPGRILAVSLQVYRRVRRHGFVKYKPGTRHPSVGSDGTTSGADPGLI